MKLTLTNLPATDLEAMVLLTQRVFADYRSPRQGKFGLVYNYSETTDNEDSGLLKVVELARAGAALQFGICEGSTENGYAGYKHSVDRLAEWGFYGGRRPDVSITPIKVRGNVNTGTEAEALVRYASVANIGDVGIVAPPFHLLRAFMTTVSAMLRLDKTLRIYAIMGDELSWTQEVRHSQGTLVRTREELLGTELERLEKYRTKECGSMISAQKGLEYLRWRDQQ